MVFTYMKFQRKLAIFCALKLLFKILIKLIKDLSLSFHCECNVKE